MNKIVCPHCGAEYTPQEIFILDKFKILSVPKDENGKILEHIDYNDSESYKCDYCDKTFGIAMNIIFETAEKTVEKHVTRLHKPALFLKED